MEQNILKNILEKGILRIFFLRIRSDKKKFSWNKKHSFKKYFKNKKVWRKRCHKKVILKKKYFKRRIKKFKNKLSKKFERKRVIKKYFKKRIIWKHGDLNFKNI